MTESAERRTEPRVPSGDAALLVIAREDDAGQAALRVEARLIDRSRSGCCVALERLQLDGLHLLDCLEDPGTFRIEVTLPAARKAEPARIARVVWINRVFEGPGPAFRIGLALGKSA